MGTSICIDSASYKSRLDVNFGHLIRVLVEMDLTHPIHYNVFVEREGFSFFLNIEYENIPALYTHCKKTGHEMQDCKILRRTNSNQFPKTKVSYVPKPIGNPSNDPEIDIYAALATNPKERISNSNMMTDRNEDSQVRVLETVNNNSLILWLPAQASIILIILFRRCLQIRIHKFPPL